MVAEPFAGPDVTVTAGTVVSTANCRETVKAPCWTVNVWLPSVRDGLVYGDVQAWEAAPSMLHLMPPESGEENAKLGVGSLVGDPRLGPVVITRPILQALAAGEPTLPALSLART